MNGLEECPPFERGFSERDPELFAELTAGLIGLPCTQSNPRPGYGLWLDFGELGSHTLHPSAPGRRPVTLTRGVWGIAVRKAHVAVVRPSGEMVLSRDAGLERVYTCLPLLRGAKVEEIGIQPADLTLSLGLSGGVRLILLTDHTSGEEEEQWTILAPGSRSITASPGRRWSLRER
jgi:hypothetical protein